MDEFDRLGIESAVRAMIGDVDLKFKNGEALTPMNIFTNLGERRLARPVTMVWVDDGLPGHFTLEGRPDLPVIFHSRQVELSAYFRNLYVQTALRTLRVELTESFTLRLVAELLLVHGKVDQALQCLGKSKEVTGGVAVFQPKIMPDLEYAPIDETYMTLWFHGLGHEFGHHIDKDQCHRLCALPFLDLHFIATLIANIVDTKYPVAADRDLFRRAQGETLKGTEESYISTELLRTEAIADIFAATLLSKASRLVLEKRNLNGELLLYETLLSMACLTLIQQCKIMASWFSDHRIAEQQTLAISNVALTVRYNLFIRACRSPEIPKIVGDFFSFQSLPDAFDMMHPQSEVSRCLKAGIDRTRAFLCSPTMRDPALFYDFARGIRNHFEHLPDVRDFLKIAKLLNCSTPELDLLSDAVQA